MLGRRVENKLERILRGERPRVLDLFAGCGGFTLGFHRAGFESLGAIEADPDAVRSHAYNFHRDRQDIHGQAREVILEGGAAAIAQVAALVGDGLDPIDAVDVIVAGPPCPTFSRIGRAKLNHLQAGIKQPASGERQLDLFLRDTRSSLYEAVPAYAEALQPVAIVVENVPEFLCQRGTNHGHRLAEMLNDLGYEVSYTLLNAALYGVPQWRERFFLVAVHKSAGTGPPTFPAPVRSSRHQPEGHRMNRKGALKLVPGARADHPGQLMMVRVDHWVQAPRESLGLPDPVTVDEAIRDLPEYHEHRGGPLGRDVRYWERDWQTPYGTTNPSEYGLEMKSWPGFSTDGGFPGAHHLARHTTLDSSRDARIFARLQPGDGFLAAVRIAEGLLQEEVARQATARRVDPEQVDRELRPRFVPPYARDKFDSKWCKLDPIRPSHTLTAHLCKDTYSHIHPDSSQARMITIQEAARLQSFPDGFVFRCAMNSAFRQIGNSVPPLLAFALAGHLRATLGLPGIILRHSGSQA